MGLRTTLERIFTPDRVREDLEEAKEQLAEAHEASRRTDALEAELLSTQEGSIPRLRWHRESNSFGPRFAAAFREEMR